MKALAYEFLQNELAPVEVGWNDLGGKVGCDCLYQFVYDHFEHSETFLNQE